MGTNAYLGLHLRIGSDWVSSVVLVTFNTYHYSNEHVNMLLVNVATWSHCSAWGHYQIM